MQNVIVKHFLDMLTFEKSNFLVLCFAKPRIFVLPEKVHVTNSYNISDIARLGRDDSGPRFPGIFTV